MSVKTRVNRLELLSSPPGTGKTTHCLELFRNEILKTRRGIQARAFFILPNREHAERIQNLLLKQDLDGLFNAHILTLTDFTSRLLGISAGMHPTEALRRTLLKGVLEDESLRLPYFQELRRSSGFHHLLADTIQEFKQSLLTIQQFEKLAQGAKFRDFCAVFKRYEAALKSLGLREPEDDIQRILRFKSSRPFADSPQSAGESVQKRFGTNPQRFLADLVIFDGFYRFTRAQRAFIRAIARRSRRTVITLTLPEGSSNRPALFEYSQGTRRFLERIGFGTQRRAFLENHRTRDPALRHLEKNLFAERPLRFAGVRHESFRRTPAVAIMVGAPSGTIAILEGENAASEIRLVAQTIKRLYRMSEIHYSDFCVILRRVGAYERVMTSVFREYGIPFFVHERKKLIEHGFARTLDRFLNLPLENWKREDLAAVLKSSYLAPLIVLEDGLSILQAAASENVLEGRSGWEKLLAHPALSESAKKGLGFLLEWEKRLLEAAGVHEFSRSLLSFVGTLDRAGSGRDVFDAEVQRALESILKGARHYYDGSAPQRRFSGLGFIRELKEAVQSGLFSLKAAGKNCVQVYDAVMALPKEYKVVFIAGLLEKQFPAAVMEDPLFKDAERRALNQKEIFLEERLERVQGERYFFYMAVTRAREKLYLSYPLYDDEGRPLLASFFVEEVKRCFESLPVFSMREDRHLEAPESWETEEELTRGLAWMNRHRVPRPETALRDPRILEIFRSFEGPFSPTRLESFATCAFKHFAGEILRLDEPLEGRAFLQMGNILHEVLESFYNQIPAELREDPALWENESFLRKSLAQRLEECLRKNPFRQEPLYRQRIYQDDLQEALDLFASREAEFFKKRKVYPAHFEFRFDSLSIPDGERGLRVQGRIDRVDVSPDKKKALVIDYKRGKRRMGLSEKVERGLELQLPLYAMAVHQLLGLRVIGAELRFLKDDEYGGLYREEARTPLSLHPQRGGVMADVEFEELLEKTRAVVRDSVRRLHAGDISVKSKSCDSCPFYPVCRFERWRLTYDL